MRKKIVAGNWKMNKSLTEGLALTQEIIRALTNQDSDGPIVVINPPFIHLSEAKKLIPDGKNLFLGAQNCYYETSGAYTGEISVDMLASIPVSYTIVGHSERREYFGESDEELAKKVNLLLEKNITPIFCCGESLKIREQGNHIDYVSEQITKALFHLSSEQMNKIVIAYEPIWAIGTGKTASSEQAQEMQAALRKHIENKYNEQIANELSILYGGSVKPNNAAELFAQPDVDGGLIGGASLKTADFVEIVKAAS